MPDKINAYIDATVATLKLLKFDGALSDLYIKKIQAMIDELEGWKCYNV